MAQDKLSRRSFLKGAAAVGLGGVITAGLAACTTGGSGGSSSGDTSGITWDKEAEIVVLGNGAGGLFAATYAARAGAKVLVIEKATQEESGGNTRVSGNMWTIATEATEGFKYYLAASEKPDMAEYLTALVNDGTNHLNNEWLPSFPDMTVTKLPIFSPEFAALPGGSVIQAWCNVGTGESQLWKSLQAGAEAESNIEWMYETPGKELIVRPDDGMVIGVKATNNGKDINIKAKKAVVLGTGGYEYNKEMLENSYPGWPPYSRGTPYNTGDGIAMAQKVGAKLWHMNASDSGTGAVLCPGLNFGGGKYDSDGVPANFALGVASKTMKNYIYVNKHGQRFMPEDRADGHGFGRREYLYFYDGVKCEWPNLPLWCIFDSVQAAAPICKGAKEANMSLFTWFAAYSGYQWSTDNSKEVEKGWILKADTIADLTQKMNDAQKDDRKELFRDPIVIDAAVLQKTIDDYNRFATNGVDEQFGRAGDKMAPLVGPYYAVRVYPNQYNTQGGPKRNTKAQTLDAFDKPIPHLYSVGECGAGYAWVYNGGWNNAEAMITGHWAAENGVAETAWDA